MTKWILILLLFPPRAYGETCASFFVANDLPRPNMVYTFENVDSHLLTLRFEAGVINDLAGVESKFMARLTRAILRGFVGAHSGSGIVRLRDIHRDLVEVKVMGTDLRVLGCNRNGHLTLKRLTKKRNENKGGALARFAYLCAE